MPPLFKDITVSDLAWADDIDVPDTMELGAKALDFRDVKFADIP